MCSKFIDATGLQQVTEWTRRKSRRNIALFLDRQNGLSHELLNEEMSRKEKEKLQTPELGVTVIVPKAGEYQPQPSMEQDSVARVANDNTPPPTTDIEAEVISF